MSEGSLDAEPEGIFEITLLLSAERCSGCGQLREPGRCPDCGVEVPASEEVAEIAGARGAALTPIDRDLESLVESFEDLPEGNIPVSNDQFATAVADSGVFAQVRELRNIGHELESLDLNDPATIGGELRRRMMRRVEAVRSLLGGCRELALFDPRGPAGELRAIAGESGRRGAELTRAFIAVLLTETIPAARAAEGELRRLLADGPDEERIAALEEQMAAWAEPDVDARVGLVLGRGGVYTDEHGFLDPGAIFASFAPDEQPLPTLGRLGRGYFRHLLGDGTAVEPALESFLILPAVGLAGLDRPLPAHRIAAGVFHLAREATSADAEGVEALIRRTVGEGGLIFEGLQQIKRGMKLLAAGEEIGAADEGAVLKTIMEAYKELSETSFRTYGALVLDLERAKAGASVAGPGDPPMLGTLTERLEASAETVARELGSSVDSELRNACGHAQYRWEAATEEVHDLRTDRRWSVEELETRVEAIGAAIAGADAGYSCFLVADQAELQMPAWASAGAAPGITAMLASMTFGARGFHVLEVRDDGQTVVIADSQDLGQMELMATLGGLCVVAPDDGSLRVLSEAGSVLLDVEVDAFRRAAEAKEGLKDLSIVIPFFSNAVHTEDDPGRALSDWLAVMVNQLVVSAEPDHSVQEMLALGDRFDYVIDFARGSGVEPPEEIVGLLRRLRRCRGLAFAVAQGSNSSFPALAGELLELNAWVAERGIPWPPR